MIFSILREEYLKLIEDACKTVENPLNNAYRFCAAKLIHLFEWQTKQGKEKVQVTRKEIYERYLLKEHGKDAIAAAINFLQDVMGILNFEQNDRADNKRNGQNKTYFYEFNWNKVTELLSPPQSESSHSNGDSSTHDCDCSPTIKDLPNTFPITSPTTEGREEKEESVEVDEDITSESSTPPPMTKGSSTPRTSKVVLPRAAALERNGVKLSDGKLLDLAEKFPDRVAAAVDAWLNWADKKVIEKPTESLRSAIAKSWQPDKPQVLSRSEVNPPPSQDILDRIKDKFHRLIQMPWGDSGECWGTYIDNTAIPWWEAQKLLT